MLRSRKGKRQLEFLSISQYSSKMIDRVKEFFKEHYESVKKKCRDNVHYQRAKKKFDLFNSKVRTFLAWSKLGF